MSAVLDISEQRRIEELSRQQQERLQATARLATVGEMASLLSHELNQPLAAIASYATGSLNLMDDAARRRGARRRDAGDAAPGDPAHRRAGRARRPRDQERARLRAAARAGARGDRAPTQLIDAVLPLVRLQARKSGTRVEVDCRRPRRACCATARWSSRCC